MVQSSNRSSARQLDQLREIKLLPNFSKHAEGSCLVQFGETHVLCAASVETRMPQWRRDSGKGWISAEYGMLPRSTNSRTDREATRGKQSGRTQEIQRLIGRSLRSIVNLDSMGEIQIRLDCDVIQADGGTRTAAITGAYVALHKAFEHCQKSGKISAIPINDSVAAVSCGILNNEVLLDLDYVEDSSAQADANFVLTGKNQIVEIQCAAEQSPFSYNSFKKLFNMALKGIGVLTQIQKQALNAN